MQLSATPTAAHMRKVQKPSIAGEASRRIDGAQRQDGPPESWLGVHQLMSAMGQASEIDTLEREYMVFAGLLPLQISMDRGARLERETGLSASSPNLVVAYFGEPREEGREQRQHRAGSEVP